MSYYRKKMEKLAGKLKSMYLTENPLNASDADYGYKYFICFYNTNTVAFRSKSIVDMIDILEDIIENGVHEGAYTFY